jgi:pyridoxine kinase
VKGQKATPDTLNEVFEGLETNGLAEYDKILTGYVPGAEALEVVEKRIQAMMERNPEIVYILDRESPNHR